MRLGGKRFEVFQPDAQSRAASPGADCKSALLCSVMTPPTENPPCPLLPPIDRALTAADSRELGSDRGEAFYAFCHRYAQSKWMSGLPAQALLQLNRAMSADLRGDEPVLETRPMPYGVMAWILEQRPDQRGQFMANPRRHWQHYATRMSGARAELRTWRAWACHTIATRILPADEFPDDEKQIAEEKVAVPSLDEILEKLRALGLPGEADLWHGFVLDAEG